MNDVTYAPTATVELMTRGMECLVKNMGIVEAEYLVEIAGADLRVLLGHRIFLKTHVCHCQRASPVSLQRCFSRALASSGRNMRPRAIASSKSTR